MAIQPSCRSQSSPLVPLSQYLGAWLQLPNLSQWLVRTIRLGYSLQFARCPPKFRGILFTSVRGQNAPILLACPPGRDVFEVLQLLLHRSQDRARAIGYRQHNHEAVGGFFSQIGSLYMVHHLWAYKDLQSREHTRNAAWQHEGWDEAVYYTVPLIQHMESRIMIPLKASPLQ